MQDRDKVREWMKENLPKYEYGSSFDLAVDCCYDLDLFDNEWDYTIPQWVIEEAEGLNGKDESISEEVKKSLTIISSMSSKLDKDEKVIVKRALNALIHKLDKT